MIRMKLSYGATRGSASLQTWGEDGYRVTWSMRRTWSIVLPDLGHAKDLYRRICRRLR